MNVNLFDSIFKIMTEYENLLKFSKNNKLNNNFTNNLNENLNNNEQETFFKYIYNHIKINKSKTTLQENIETNCNNMNNINTDHDNKLSNNNMNDLNTDKNNISMESESNNILEDQHKLIIDTFIKKIYKKVILKCHPDKNGDNNLFIKCQEYYEKKFLIGILYIAYIIKYSLPSIDNIIINQILIEIRIIQHNIDLLKEKIYY